MPKSKKVSRETRPAEETQRLHARAYASRLAKQVADELDTSRRSARPPKKLTPPRRT